MTIATFTIIFYNILSAITLPATVCICVYVQILNETRFFLKATLVARGFLEILEFWSAKQGAAEILASSAMIPKLPVSGYCLRHRVCILW